jgi:hypothetical protein
VRTTQLIAPQIDVPYPELEPIACERLAVSAGRARSERHCLLGAVERFAHTLSSSWRASLLHIAFNLHSASRIASSIDSTASPSAGCLWAVGLAAFKYWRTSSKRSDTSSPQE